MCLLCRCLYKAIDYAIYLVCESITHASYILRFVRLFVDASIVSKNN